jgi:protease I
MADKKILMVVAPHEFRDEEFSEPYEYFTQEKHWDVVVASTTPGTATGMLGKTLEIEEAITNQDSDDFDAIVIVGGMGSPTHLWNNPPLIQLVKDFNSDDKVVAAICLSGVVLAKAGILEGKKATVWDSPESMEEFEKWKVHYVKQDVMVDDNIITAVGPSAAMPFAIEIAKALSRVSVG